MATYNLYIDGKLICSVNPRRIDGMLKALNHYDCKIIKEETTQ